MPAAGYPLEPIRVEGISRSNPLKAARARSRGGRRAAHRARRSCARRGADAVLGGGGYVAGPGRARRGRRAASRSCYGGRLAPRPHQPAAGAAARAARLPRLPARGPRRRALPRHGPPRAAARRPTAPAARAAFGLGPDERCVLVFGGSLGARSINEAAVARVRRRALPRPAHRRPPRLRRTARAPGPHYDLRDYVTPFGPALAAADLAVARAGGSVFELAQYGLPGRADPVPARERRPPDHQRALDGGRAAPRRSIADAELTPERLRADGRRDPAGRPRGWRAMAAAVARARAPRRGRGVAREVLAAARSSIR